jgi:MarR family transcriptional regulator, organic hydroperoxide resistance regulator
MSVLVNNEVKHIEIERFMNDEISKCMNLSVSPIHVYILNELYKSDVQKASDLARLVGRAATSFTPILDQLESKFLIERRIHPSDRRAVNICLTEAGKSLREGVQQVVARTEKKFGGK